MDTQQRVEGFGPKCGAALLASLFVFACRGSGEVVGENPQATGGTAGTTIVLPPASGGGGGTTEPGTSEPGTTWPPAGYVNVTDSTTGAYALGPQPGSDGNPSTKCTGLLFGVVRDFKLGSKDGGHPDFETAPSGLDRGIVESALDSDGKPVYARSDGDTSSTSGKANFDQWYRDVKDVNMPFILGLRLVDVGGTSTFAAIKPKYFFPLDGQGFGNEDESHNFGFTTELHTSFVYKGGESFTFVGDDDVWVFIDKKLVIDLGGRHGQTNGSVRLDTLGLTVGNTYDLAVFHAERHTSESNFQIQTTLSFTDCGQINGVIY